MGGPEDIQDRDLDPPDHYERKIHIFFDFQQNTQNAINAKIKIVFVNLSSLLPELSVFFLAQSRTSLYTSGVVKPLHCLGCR